MLFIEGEASKFLSRMMFRASQIPSIGLSILVVLAPFCGIGAQPAAEGQYDGRAISHYLDGELYMLRGDYDQASAAYEGALRYDSSSATLYLALAEALLKTEQLERSRLTAEKAQLLEPDDPIVYEFLARNAAARNDLESALTHLNRWSELDPADLNPLFRKAGLLISQKKYAEAIDTYIAIYDRDPDQERILPRAGEIALSMGDRERAYQVYRRLHERLPEDLRVARAYAETCVQTERFEEAIQVYERLNFTEAATLATRLQLAWLHLQNEDYVRAQGILLPLIDQGHRQWDVLRLAGMLASQMADHEELVKISRLMAEIYPDSAMGHTSLAIALVKLDDKSGAVEVLVGAMERFPANPEVNYLLGNLYFTLERYDQAEKPLLTALEKRPEDGHIRHLLASTWSSPGRYAASDSLFEELLKTAAGEASILNNYAYSIADRPQIARKQLKYARKLSRASLKLQQDNAAFLNTYGWIWHKLKRYRKASKYIARSLAVNSDNPVVLEHMAEVYLKLGKVEQWEAFIARAREIRQAENPSVVRAPVD